MSAGNPDRARRDRKVVDYTGRDADKELRDALAEAHGDTTSLDVAGAPSELDVNEKRSVDRTFRPSADDDSDYDSDDAERVSRKKTKSDAERAAEMAVAEGLNVSYPKGFVATRKGLHYAALAACRGSQSMGVRYGLNRVIVDDRLTPADRNTVVAMASEVASHLRLPRQALANTFEPLSNFNGGIFTKTGQNMPTLAALAIGVELADRLADFRANGSAQHQSFAELLGNAGLHGDVLTMLTQQHSTETPEESARNCGLKLVEQLNALDDVDLVASLYYNLAHFPQRASRFQPAGYKLSREYDYTRFDNTKPKGAVEIADKKGAFTVSLSLLHRSTSTDRYPGKLGALYGEDALPGNAGYKPCYSFVDSEYRPCDEDVDNVGHLALVRARKSTDERYVAARQAYLDLYNDPEKAEEMGEIAYRTRLNALRRELDKILDGLVAEEKKVLTREAARKYDEFIASLGDLNETHRAQVDVLAPQSHHTSHIVEALKSMLLSTKEEHKAIAPKLKEYLMSLGADIGRRALYDDGTDPTHRNYWGCNKHAYLGVRFDGVACKLGRKDERNRSIHTKNQGYLHHGVRQCHKSTDLQNWLQLDNDVSTKCLAELMLPPWKMHKGTGTIEFFLLITDVPPEDVISLGIPRKMKYDDDLKRAVDRAVGTDAFKQRVSEYRQQCYAKMHKGQNPDGIEKIRLSAAEKQELADLHQQAMDDAEATYRAQHPFKKRGSFVMGYDWSPSRAGCDTPAHRAKRARDADAGRASKVAKDNHERVVAANPVLGGSDIANTTGFGCD